jgi:hypothetical protein
MSEWAKLIMASVHFNNVNTTSYAGDISISGLPVTSKNTSTAMFMGNVYNSGMISGATDSVQALVADNGTTISFLENANNSALAWGTVGAGKHMRVQVVTSQPDERNPRMGGSATSSYTAVRNLHELLDLFYEGVAGFSR